MFWLFRDRSDAGQRLAERLRAYAGRRDVLVLALPRGGVPAGQQVAQALGVPLDVLVVHRLSASQHGPTLGAIAAGGVVYIDEDLVHDLRLGHAVVKSLVVRGRVDLERRERLYRGERLPLDVRGKIVIVVDDGVATGATLRAAVTALRALQPARIVVAVPVAPSEAARKLTALVDDFVCLKSPDEFRGIGQFYRAFDPMTDAEVQAVLEQSRSGST